jgi:DNA-directed RNA polymerase specialized sigma24 family protein
VRVDRLLQAQSDERLALLVRNGHDFAFEELVRRYRDPLTRYLRRLLGDPHVAEDALERGLIRAWAALLAGTSPIEFRQWIYGTVHASAVGSIAARAKLRPELADRETAEARAAAAGLSDRQRTALVMAVRGYRQEAVARSLGIDDGPVVELADRARAAARGAFTALTPPRALVRLAAVSA